MPSKTALAVQTTTSKVRPIQPGPTDHSNKQVQYAQLRSVLPNYGRARFKAPLPAIASRPVRRVPETAAAPSPGHPAVAMRPGYHNKL